MLFKCIIAGAALTVISANQSLPEQQLLEAGQQSQTPVELINGVNKLPVQGSILSGKVLIRRGHRRRRNSSSDSSSSGLCTLSSDSSCTSSSSSSSSSKSHKKRRSSRRHKKHRSSRHKKQKKNKNKRKNKNKKHKKGQWVSSRTTSDHDGDTSNDSSYSSEHYGNTDETTETPDPDRSSHDGDTSNITSCSADHYGNTSETSISEDRRRSRRRTDKSRRKGRGHTRKTTRMFTIREATPSKFADRSIKRLSNTRIIKKGPASNYKRGPTKDKIVFKLNKNKDVAKLSRTNTVGYKGGRSGLKKRERIVATEEIEEDEEGTGVANMKFKVKPNKTGEWTRAKKVDDDDEEEEEEEIEEEEVEEEEVEEEEVEEDEIEEDEFEDEANEDNEEGEDVEGEDEDEAENEDEAEAEDEEDEAKEEPVVENAPRRSTRKASKKATIILESSVKKPAKKPSARK